MKTTFLLSFASLIAALAAPGWAAKPDEHASHHPAGPTVVAAPTATVKPGTEGARMDEQTHAMKAMHEKMMAAKTPQERSALMGEHMKTMGAGMAMMQEVPKQMGNANSPKNVAAHHAMMHKHMALMGATMEMMSDRLPEVPK